MDKICAYCGKTYKVRSCKANTSRYCSRECAVESGREKIVCPVCGKEFLIKKSHSGRRKYCSKECMAVGYQCSLKGEANPNYKASGTKTCEQCGCEFHTYNSKRRFCSVECSSAYHSKPESPNSRRRIAPKVFPQKKVRYCTKCGGAFYGRHRKLCDRCNPKTRLDKKSRRVCTVCGKSFVSHNSKTCSKKCSAVWRAQIQQGEKSHRWQGGKTTAVMIVRGSLSYANWRKSIFTRDDYTCALCGKKGGRLAAHHILKFSENENLRLDYFNGITLCYKCHAEIVNGHEKEYERIFMKRACTYTLTGAELKRATQALAQ